MTDRRASFAERLARSRARTAASGFEDPDFADLDPSEADPPASEENAAADYEPSESKKARIARLRLALRRLDRKSGSGSEPDAEAFVMEVRQDPASQRGARQIFEKINRAPGLDAQWAGAWSLPDVPPGEAFSRFDHDHPLDADYGPIRPEALLGIPPARTARLHKEPSFDGLDLSSTVFMDTETSGLAGGTGTFAFLVGIARVQDDAFRTTQFLMRSPAGEGPMLDAIAEAVDGSSGLVTYNGASFDLPLLETRCTLHGRTSPFSGLDHLDMLPPSRRLFGPPRLPRVTGEENEFPDLRDFSDGCGDARLGTLEQCLLGVTRDEDVPGSSIPGIFFEFLREGDHPAMPAVLSHNRYDLLSLAALTVVAADRMADDWDTDRANDLAAAARHFAVRDEREAAAGLLERALAAGLSGIHRDRALLDVGMHYRRREDFAEAVRLWSEVQPGDTPEWIEALEHLAKHDEHRRRDFLSAILRVQDARERLPRALALSAEGRRKRDNDLAYREKRLHGKATAAV